MEAIIDKVTYSITCVSVSKLIPMKTNENNQSFKKNITESSFISSLSFHALLLKTDYSE